MDSDSSRKKRRLSVDCDNLDNDAGTTNIQNIRVVARVRPLSSKEVLNQANESIIAFETSSVVAVVNDRKFEFDAVFNPQASQEQVYEQTAAELVRKHLFHGFNVTILAYGQTGSGKTHTMLGSFLKDLSDGDGITARAVRDVFSVVSQLCNPERASVEMSYLEIYNEDIRDLLTNDAKPQDLTLRDTKDGVVVQNLSWHAVTSPGMVSELITVASQRRVTGATAMNSESSRSHAVCTLNITIKPSTTSETSSSARFEEIRAKLSLVDLAGSERIKRTCAEGARMKEGININKGLFVLGQVIAALSESAHQSHNSSSASVSSMGSTHIKYRDSKLTRLLQDSLGGNSKTVMVACVSPADVNVEESLNTLRYASRARKIKNVVVRNTTEVTVSPSEAAALRQENKNLKLLVSQLQSKLNSCSLNFDQQLKPETNSSSPQQRTSDDCCTAVMCGVAPSNYEFLSQRKVHTAITDAKTLLLEKRNEKLIEDILIANSHADKWQMKYFDLLKVVTESGIAYSCDVDPNTYSIVDQLRKEIFDVKEQLFEAETSVAISRAAIAVFTCSGNTNFECMHLMDMGTAMTTSDQDELKMERENLSSELVAMSGSIEMKEKMMSKFIKERECIEVMQSYIQSTIASLQQEVEALSAERDELLTTLRSDTSKSVRSLTSAKVNERVLYLESKIRALSEKLDSHSKVLRQRELAEKRCEQLQAEILADKKKRATLQRKLKEISEERRAEKKAAALNASKLLRDSQKLKFEVARLKDTAARQDALLRRKASNILTNQRKSAENIQKSSTAKISQNCEITIQRRDELNILLDDAIASMSSSDDIRCRITALPPVEIAFVFTALYDRFLCREQKYKALQSSVEKIINDTRLVETRRSEKALLDLKIQHSNDIVLLLNSTNDTVENTMKRINLAQDTVIGDDISFETTVNDLLSSYMSTCRQLGESVKKDLSELRESQTDVKNCVDAITSGLIISEIDPLSVKKEDFLSQKNHDESSVITVVKQEFLSTASEMHRVSPSHDDTYALIEMLDESVDEAVIDDKDDSDWNPDTPVSKKPKHARNKSGSLGQDPEIISEKDIPAKEHTIDGKTLESMTVNELRAELRSRGLPVSGKKADLLARLQPIFPCPLNCREHYGFGQHASHESYTEHNSSGCTVSDNVSNAAIYQKCIRPPLPTNGKTSKLNQKRSPPSSHLLPAGGTVGTDSARKRPSIVFDEGFESSFTSRTSLSLLAKNGLEGTRSLRRSSRLFSHAVSEGKGNVSVAKAEKEGSLNTRTRSRNGASIFSIINETNDVVSKQLQCQSMLSTHHNVASSDLHADSLSRSTRLSALCVENKENVPSHENISELSKVIESDGISRNARRTSLCTITNMTEPVSILTNSAKKRRRRSMADSVNRALMQFEMMENLNNVH